MPIPSESDFDIIITLLQNFNAAELANEVEQVEPNFDSIYAFVIRMESSLQNKLKEIEKTTVQIWLKQDKNYCEGYKKAFGAQQDDPAEDEKSLIKTTDYFLNIFNNAAKGKHIIHKFHADQPEVACYKMLHHRLRQSCHQLKGSWELMFCMALRDYFFNGSDNYIQNNKRMIDLVDKAHTAASELLEFIHETENMPMVRVNNTCLLESLSKFHTEIGYEQRFMSGNLQTYPLKRTDKTIEERILIYRIWSWFINNSRGNKTSALVSFIHIEGIKFPVDHRTIEAQVQGWNNDIKDYLSSV